MKKISIVLCLVLIIIIPAFAFNLQKDKSVLCNDAEHNLSKDAVICFQNYSEASIRDIKDKYAYTGNTVLDFYFKEILYNSFSKNNGEKLLRIPGLSFENYQKSGLDTNEVLPEYSFGKDNLLKLTVSHNTQEHIGGLYKKNNYNIFISSNSPGIFVSLIDVDSPRIAFTHFKLGYNETLYKPIKFNNRGNIGYFFGERDYTIGLLATLIHEQGHFIDINIMHDKIQNDYFNFSKYEVNGELLDYSHYTQIYDAEGSKINSPENYTLKRVSQNILLEANFSIIFNPKSIFYAYSPDKYAEEIVARIYAVCVVPKINGTFDNMFEVNPYFNFCNTFHVEKAIPYYNQLWKELIIEYYLHSKLYDYDQLLAYQQSSIPSETKIYVTATNQINKLLPINNKFNNDVDNSNTTNVWIGIIILGLIVILSIILVIKLIYDSYKWIKSKL